MQLQQLEYALEVARCGSINAAAKNLYMSQPSLSLAVKNLEQELGCELFDRSSHGVRLTSAGADFIDYARRVIEQRDILLDHFIDGGSTASRFSLSAQNGLSCADAALAIVDSQSDGAFNFAFRDRGLSETMDDVRTQRAQLGVIHFGAEEAPEVLAACERCGLHFEELSRGNVVAVVSPESELAACDEVCEDDLSGHIALIYERPSSDPGFYRGETFTLTQCERVVAVTNRAAMSEMLRALDGFTLTAQPKSLTSDFVSIPLVPAREVIEGYICRFEQPLDTFALRFIEELRRR